MLRCAAMIKIYSQLLFACALLLSQTALLSHDVKHLSSGHNELCAVYVSQDHSTDNVALNVPPIFQVSSDIVQDDTVNLFVPSLISSYSSRAPPKSIFLS